MNLKILPILIIVLIIVLLIKLIIKNSSNNYNSSIDKFMKNEIKANYVIKNFNSLNLDYVLPNKEILPFKEYENENDFKEIIKKQNIVKRKLELKMIKLPKNMLNSELKEMYGANNFEKISVYEEHFNSYIKSLLDWANKLNDLNNLKDCEIILDECISLESDISQIYLLKGDILVKKNDKEGLLNLISTVEKYDLSLKSKILSELKEKLKKGDIL